MPVRRRILAVLVVWIGVAAPAAAQDIPFAPPTFATIAPGETRTGTLEDPNVQHVFQLDVAAGFSVVQAHAKQTNTRCEVWATIYDLDDTVLGRAYLLGADSTVTGLVAAAGPVYVMLDDGPFARCSGAAYELQVTVGVLPASALEPATSTTPTVPAAASADSSPTATVACYAWCTRAEQISTKIRRTLYARRRADGQRRARLTRKLRQLRRSYLAARNKAERSCGVRT